MLVDHVLIVPGAILSLFLGGGGYSPFHVIF